MLEKGMCVPIHCYKGNGNIHRCWNSTYVLEETERHFITVNNSTVVVEKDGRRWRTREPAICYFSKDGWFNVICMIRNNGVHYYCNIATPTIYNEGALKYIDYDLDLKVFPDYSYKVLDKEEYKYHKKIMHYSDELDHVLNLQLERLIEMVINNQGPFNREFVNYWYNVYLESTGLKDDHI